MHTSDSLIPRSARDPLARTQTLEEQNTSHSGTSPLLEIDGQSKAMGDESMLSSIAFGDSATRHQESFITDGDNENDPTITPNFGKEQPDADSSMKDDGLARAATLSRAQTEEIEMNRGILVHSLQTLFDEIAKRERVENRIFIVKCAYFEIYNDQVFDLLNEQFIQAPEPLQVLEDRVSRI